MDRKGLVNVISEVLLPLGFKRKGNYWVVNGSDLSKMVNLQKSQFGSRFYINYGFILNSVPLGRLMLHVFYGLYPLDSSAVARARLSDLLDLDVDLQDEERASELKQAMNATLVPTMTTIDTEDDILRELKTFPTLNSVPLVVKRHFGLPEE